MKSSFHPYAHSILLLVATFCLAEVRAEEAPKESSRILETVKYLADDDRDGRGIGTDGIKEAAEFVAKKFADLGLETSIYDGKPYQEFTTRIGVSQGEEGETWLKFILPEDGEEAAEEKNASSREEGEKEGSDRDGKDDSEPADESDFEVALELDTDFSSLAIGGSGEFNAELVFAGYGITADRLDYDDYADLDVKGKVVILLRKEPQQRDPQSKFNGTDASRHAQFRTKIRNAEAHGAAAVLLVNDSITPEDSRATIQSDAQVRWRRLLKMAKDLQSAKDAEDADVDELKSTIDTVTEEIESLHDRYEEIDDENYDPIMGFQDIGTRPFSDLPVFFVTREQIDDLLRASIDKDLATLEDQIDEDCQPHSEVLTGWRAAGASKVVPEQANLRNVLAVLPGSGPLADETIVIGAHYDHVGMGGPGSLAPWTKEVHNGADDNASGTTALLEVATILATREKKPRRRIVFIAFSGEESGLLGSAHYCKDPRFPLEDTIAMLNLDMVGRLEDNLLHIEGTGSATDFDGLVSQLNDDHGFRLKKKASGFGPSDHASFYSKKVPVLFLFTGLHKDYHRPGDDWDKINVEGIERVVDFGIDIIDTWDRSDDRPEYRATRRGLMGSLATADRVVLGIMLDRNASEEGVVVGGVSDDGPASKAGIVAGDIIRKVDGKETNDIGDLRSVLADHKDGDKVDVVVDRDGEEKVVEVTLKKAG